MSSAVVVIISSSPPRAFARSPTLAETPSPLRSPGTPVRDGVKRFKSSDQTRDRFSSGFSSARALLTKSGAENIPLRSPNQVKFKPQSSQQPRNGTGVPAPAAKFVKKKPLPAAEQLSDHFKPSKLTVPPIAPNAKPAPEVVSLGYDDGCEGLGSLLHNEKPEQSRQSSPHPLEKAAPRRMDWTPVKSTEDFLETPEPDKHEGGLTSTLLSSYAFTSVSNALDRITTKADGSRDQLKRKRIELVLATEAIAPSSVLDSTIAKEAKRSGKGKGKAPPRKALTITGLATSAYGAGVEKEGRVPPMVEYLTATQAAARSDSESVMDVSLKKLSKTKAPSKKARGTAKALATNRLVSPTSAMKTTLELPFVFGPASQLAHDESPNLMRDTLEALKRSEEISSDPFSPQQTQPFSIESTSPRVTHGMGRLVKRRDLWSAAGRDADNALLQLEPVDLTDSPAVRQALAGKDALLQLDGPKQLSIDPRTKARARTSATETPLTKSIGPVIDIYDIVTPGIPRRLMTSIKSPARAMHTTRALEQPQDKSNARRQPLEAEPIPQVGPTKPIPVMPSYEGWSDDDLKKQIAKWGFKPVRQREKMIELLGRCWRSKHNTESDGDDHNDPTDALTHGDFLSKVHDISARPTPKVKKPRAKRKSESGEPATPKEPKRRKKAVDESGNVPKKEKAPRKRATRKKVIPDEKIVDVDDIQDSNIEHVTTNLDNPLAASTKGKKKTIARPATPPPTLPQLDFTSSSPALEHNQQAGAATGLSVDNSDIRDADLTPEQTPLAAIMTQIHAAIHHSAAVSDKAQDSRNHQTSPTWREKILLYDPIVLEELTVWLNTEGFKSIGEDREVSPLEVRDWCEQNGVCCLGVGGGWRGRGKPAEGE